MGGYDTPAVMSLDFIANDGKNVKEESDGEYGKYTGTTGEYSVNRTTNSETEITNVYTVPNKTLRSARTDIAPVVKTQEPANSVGLPEGLSSVSFSDASHVNVLRESSVDSKSIGIPLSHDLQGLGQAPCEGDGHPILCRNIGVVVDPLEGCDCGSGKLTVDTNEFSHSECIYSREEKQNCCSEGREQKRPHINGSYILGQLQDLDCIYTVDSGAGESIVSIDVYNRIPDSRRPELKKCNVEAEGASGEAIRIYGKGSFKLKLGPVEIERDLLVGSINDEVIFGDNLLRLDKDGPTDLLYSENVLLFKGERIPLYTVGGDESQAIKLISMDNVTVPGMAEMVVNALIQRPEIYEECNEESLVAETDYQFNVNHGCLLSPTVTNIKGRVSTKIRIFNPFVGPAFIAGNTVLGTLERVVVQDVVQEQEHPEDSKNHNNCRRLKLECTCCTSKRKRSWKGQTSRSPQHHQPKIRRTGRRKEEDEEEVPPHLVELVQSSEVGWSKEERKAIRKLLRDYEDVFSKSEFDLGRTHLIEHRIETGDAPPVKLPPRRTPIALAEAERQTLQSLWEKDVIEPSTSPWAAPLVLVKKPDGSTRICVDYRKHNQIITMDSYPLPRITDCLDCLAKATIFSAGDVNSAYYQIPVRKEDIPKTAFITKYGLYQYKVMPMGMKTSPATYQRLMELVLMNLQWQSCIAFLDDFLVFAADFGEHCKRLREVLQRFRNAGLKLKPKKCNFFQREVKFLGHLVNGNGVIPNPDNVRKLLEWPTPTCVTDVQVILGMGNYYRRFVKDYSKRVYPLTQLTKKDVPFEWTPECQQAFDDIKTALTSAPIMAHPIPGGEFILDTDASQTTLGAVLSQVQDGVEKVIAYGSRTLNKPERNYCVTDRELLAVRHFVEYYKCYLLGQRFRVRTDHQALRWLFSLREPKNRIARWIEVLSAYDFVVDYRPGVKHGNADAMSRRCENPQECQCPLVDEEQNLLCGPCDKCLRRSKEMQSTILGPDGKYIKDQQDEDTDPECTWVRLVRASITGEKKHSHRWGRTGRRRKALRRLRTIDITAWNSDSDSSDLTDGETDKSREEGAQASRGSNCPTTTPDKIWAMPHTMPELRKMQQDDPDLGPVVTWAEEKERPKGADVAHLSPATKHFWIYFKMLVLRQGVLFRKTYTSSGTEQYQFLVPRKMRKEILYHLHDGPIGGHFGRRKTTERVLNRFYWFKAREDIELYVDMCDICASTKKPPHRGHAKLGTMLTGSPMERISTDVIGRLPETPRGNKYILVVTDYFTKWVEIFPMPDQKAITCADIILNEVIARYGTPLSIHSDQGRNYQSKLFEELCQLLEIRKTRTSPYHPQANGLVERFNKTLMKMVIAYLEQEEENWDLHLSCLGAAYRSTVHESTHFTPNRLMLGREVRTPIDIMFGSDTTEPYPSYGQYVQEVKERMEHVHDLARKYSQGAVKRQKDHYDVKAKVHTYEIGDLVWYERASTQTHITPKLRVPYEGPYMIRRKLGPFNYELYLKKGKHIVVHVDKLKPYLGLKKPAGFYRALTEAKALASLPQSTQNH